MPRKTPPRKPSRFSTHASASPSPSGPWAKLLAELHDYQAVEWIRTGIPAIDLSIGAGIPRGRFIEVTGDPGTAKTSFMILCMVAFQRAGGHVIYLDADHKLDKEFAERLGVDWQRISYFRIKEIGELAKILSRIAETAPAKTPVLVIVDTLAILQGEKDFEQLLSGEGFSNTGGLRRAKEITDTLRTTLMALIRKNVTFIAVNQFRVKMTPYGSAGKDTPGGSAVKYSSAIRLVFRAKEKIKKPKTEVIVGQFIEMEVIRNTLAPPFRKCKVTFRFDSGFDPFSGFKEFLLTYGRIVERGGVLCYKERRFKPEELQQITSETPELLAPIQGTHESPDVRAEEPQAVESPEDQEA